MVETRAVTVPRERGPDDLDVVGPDGIAYRVCCRRRGEPFVRWNGVETGLGPLDLLFFAGAVGRQALTAVRVRFKRGWTVGVLQDSSLRWRVVQHEHVDDEASARRRAEHLAAAIATGHGPRSE